MKVKTHFRWGNLLVLSFFLVLVNVVVHFSVYLYEESPQSAVLLPKVSTFRAPWFWPDDNRRYADAVAGMLQHNISSSSTWVDLFHCSFPEYRVSYGTGPENHHSVRWAPNHPALDPADPTCDRREVFSLDEADHYPGGNFSLYTCTSGKYKDRLALGGIPAPVVDPDPPGPGSAEPLHPDHHGLLPSHPRRIIILTIDSVSREKFKRVMPVTLKALRHISNVGGTNRVFGFERFHTVGLNTGRNMVPLMAGVYHKTRFDPVHHKWLYHIAEDAGYRTMVAGDFCPGLEGNPLHSTATSFLDWPYETASRYPSKNVWPLKALCKDLYKDLWNTYGYKRTCTVKNGAGMKQREIHIRIPNVVCAADKPGYQHWFDYLRRFLKEGEGRPLFGHIHNLNYHHKYRSYLVDQDEAYAEMLTELAADHRNIILFASDHGWHYPTDYTRSHDKKDWENKHGSTYRDIWRAFAHQKSAFTYLIFPPDWEGFQGDQGIQRHNNLLKNTMRLVNHYDMHHTLNYLLTGYTTSAHVRQKQVTTLFDDVGDRSCEEIGVEPFACACEHAHRRRGDDIREVERKWCEHYSTIGLYWEEYGFCM